MSLIPLAAQLIRRAVEDDVYAQDLRDAIAADERAFEGLIHGVVHPADLGWMTPTDWQWFARFRQALGGGLDGVVLSYLAEAATTRFARFDVRALVLRDPRTNQLAPEASDLPHRLDDTGLGDIGLDWLSAEAHATRDPLELTLDALQCATEASWFVLRQLTSLGDERAIFVGEQLDAFARQREITPETTRRWRFAQ